MNNKALSGLSARQSCLISRIPKTVASAPRSNTRKISPSAEPRRSARRSLCSSDRRLRQRFRRRSWARSWADRSGRSRASWSGYCCCCWSDEQRLSSPSLPSTAGTTTAPCSPETAHPATTSMMTFRRGSTAGRGTCSVGWRPRSAPRLRRTRWRSPAITLSYSPERKGLGLDFVGFSVKRVNESITSVTVLRV